VIVFEYFLFFCINACVCLFSIIYRNIFCVLAPQLVDLTLARAKIPTQYASML